MNMVSLLVLPLVLTYHLGSDKQGGSLVTYLVILAGLLAVSWAWWQSKRDTSEMRDLDTQYEKDYALALEKKRRETAAAP
jgi:K(+)-stimulated pyrophosphate-energized sodium pump